MEKKIVFILFLLFVNIGFAQTEDNEYSEEEEESIDFKGIKDEKEKIDLSRLRIGGDLGVGFNGGVIYAEISPTFGYQIIKDRLELGPGIIYQHKSMNNIIAINALGGQAYIRGYIFDGFFAQVDGFLVNYNINDIQYQKKSSFTYGNGFIGAGYAFNHKDASIYMVLSVKTNLIIDKYSPKREIIPQFGFQFRL